MFNGAGVFQRLFSWQTDKAASVKITASRMDAEMDGFAAGLSNCVTRDGQSPPSADLPMGGRKITGLAAATADGDALNRLTGDGRYLRATSETRNWTTSGRIELASGALVRLFETTNNNIWDQANETTNLVWRYNSGIRATINASGLFSLSGPSAGVVFGSRSAGNDFEVFATGATWRVANLAAGNVPFIIDSTYIGTGFDAGLSSGTAGARWTEVYAVNGTIQTSDATAKTVVGDPEQLLLDAILAVPIRMYRWNDAIATKGEAEARIHCGVLAQEVRDAIASKGLDPRAYGLFCQDQMPDGSIRYGLRYDQFDRLRLEAVRRAMGI